MNNNIKDNYKNILIAIFTLVVFAVMEYAVRGTIYIDYFEGIARYPVYEYTVREAGSGIAYWISVFVENYWINSLIKFILICIPPIITLMPENNSHKGIKKMHIYITIPALILYLIFNIYDLRNAICSTTDYIEITQRESQIVNINFDDFNKVINSDDNFVLILKDGDLGPYSMERLEYISKSDDVDVLSFDIKNITNENEQKVFDNYIEELGIIGNTAFILIVNGEETMVTYNSVEGIRFFALEIQDNLKGYTKYEAGEIKGATNMGIIVEEEEKDAYNNRFVIDDF